MKTLIMLIMAATCLQATAQEVAITKKKYAAPRPLKGVVTATVGVGIIDYYRHHYTPPLANAYYSPSMVYNEGNTGFAPIYARVEYGITEKLGIAATFGYDDFVHNYDQQVYGTYYGTLHLRGTEKLRVLSSGIASVYYFRPLSFVPRLYPFISIGVGINHLRFEGYQKGPSSSAVEAGEGYTVTPVLKVGARYFISDQFGIYGDAGYDKLGIFSLGFSYRFFPKKCKTARDSNGRPLLLYP
jgi:hypothetical protein